KIYKFNSFSGSIGAKYNFNPTWGVRGDLSVLGIKGDGKQLTEPLLAASTFKNTLKEFTALAEFNFFKFEPTKRKAAYTPYVFAGLGAVGSAPTVMTQESITSNGTVISNDIKKHEQIIRPVIIYGAGFKYNLKGSLSIKGEF